MPEQDAAYQIKDLDRRFERLEKDVEETKREWGPKTDRLQARVQGLETTRTVLIAIAAIFGIAGSWGAVVLQKVSGMQAQVETLSTQVGELQKGAEHIRELEQQAVALADQDFARLKQRHLADFTGRMQQAFPILSGSVGKNSGDLGSSWPLDGRHPSASLDLPVTFQHPLTNPEVAVAIQGLDANTPAGVRISAYAVNITSAGFTVRVVTWATSSINGVTISWIAYGKS